jgi:hypothetical protein
MEIDVTQFAEAFLHALKDAGKLDGKKDASGNPTGPFMHGMGGLFSFAPDEHPFLNAMVHPRGVLSRLPILRSDPHQYELLTTITGVTAGSGSEPDGVCDDPPKPGDLKGCTLIVPYGRIIRSTKELSFFDLENQHSQFEELTYGRIPQQMFNPDRFFPMANVPQGGQDLHDEWGARFYLLAIEMQRALCPGVYTDDPTNNGANNGRMYTTGLDLWINTGNKRDYLSSAVCTALNSKVDDFGYNSYDGTSPDLVQMIHDVWAYINNNAMEMRLDPAKWFIAMRPNLFHLLTEIWPCRYDTDRCSNTNGTNVVIVNDDRNRAFRQQMRDGSYLLIDGVPVPVVQDSCIPREDWDDTQELNEGEFASDIYFVPETILGNMAATGWQYFDQRIRERSNARARNNQVWTTDSGMYAWATTESGGYCEAVKATLEYRLLMFTPQLAGRIQDVMYAPRQPFRDWEPDEKYYLDGGITYRPPSNFYSMWSGNQVQGDPR